MKKKSITLAVIALSALATTSSQAVLLISGMVDGTLSGGLPKAMEIYTTTDIADLSTYWIARDTNGAGPWDTFTQLPAVTLTAGNFYYIAGNTDSETEMNNRGFTVDLVDSILNQNGDDIMGLATAGNAAAVYDSIGVVAQGDTDFYQDSFAVRLNTSVTPSITDTDGSNFTITPWGDGTAFEGASGFGTFAPIPEPSSALLGGLGVLALLRRRR